MVVAYGTSTGCGKEMVKGKVSLDVSFPVYTKLEIEG